MNISFARQGLLVLGLVAGFSAPLMAAEDPLVAKVNGKEIRLSQVAAYQQSLPPQVAAQVPVQALVESMINNQIIYQQAQKSNLAKSEDVKKALAQAEQQILVKAYIASELKSRVTDAAIKARYDKFLSEFKAEEEVRALHILVESEDGAKDIIKDLKKGADFGQTAKAKSKDPSAAANGGDLGYFAKGDMVPEFANAAFAAKAGTLVEKPVKTQFGWHVIKVEDRRMGQAPSFEQAKFAVREQLAEETTETIVNEMRSKAKVETFDITAK